MKRQGAPPLHNVRGKLTISQPLHILVEGQVTETSTAIQKLFTDKKFLSEQARGKVLPSAISSIHSRTDHVFMTRPHQTK